MKDAICIIGAFIFLIGMIGLYIIPVFLVKAISFALMLLGIGIVKLVGKVEAWKA